MITHYMYLVGRQELIRVVDADMFEHGGYRPYKGWTPIEDAKDFNDAIRIAHEFRDTVKELKNER